MAEIKRKDAATARREQTVEELERSLAEAREEEFRLRFRSRHRDDRQPDAVPGAAPRHRADSDRAAREEG